MIKPAYSVSFLLSINIFVWQNVLYFLDAPRTYNRVYVCMYVSTGTLGVGVTTPEEATLRAEQPRKCGSISDKGKRFLSSPWLSDRQLFSRRKSDRAGSYAHISV